MRRIPPRCCSRVFPDRPGSQAYKGWCCTSWSSPLRFRDSKRLASSSTRVCNLFVCGKWGQPTRVPESTAVDRGVLLFDEVILMLGASLEIPRSITDIIRMTLSSIPSPCFTPFLLACLGGTAYAKVSLGTAAVLPFLQK